METSVPLKSVLMTPERANEIGMAIFQQKLEQEGLTLKPREAKLQVKSLSKRLGISKVEAAEFVTIVINRLTDKSLAKLRKISNKQ